MGTFAWELSLGLFRLEICGWDLWLGNLRLGSFAWGAGLLRLGETGLLREPGGLVWFVVSFVTRKLYKSPSR